MVIARFEKYEINVDFSIEGGFRNEYSIFTNPQIQ